MRKLLFVVIGLTLTACADYPGAKTNCWTQPTSTNGNSPATVTRAASSSSFSFVAPTSDTECTFELVN